MALLLYCFSLISNGHSHNRYSYLTRRNTCSEHIRVCFSSQAYPLVVTARHTTHTPTSQPSSIPCSQHSEAFSIPFPFRPIKLCFDVHNSPVVFGRISPHTPFH